MPLKLFGPKNIFNAVAVSGATAYRSDLIDMLCMDIASIEIQWTGDPTGVISIDGSNGGTVWYPTGMAVNNPAGNGASDNTLLDLSRTSFRYISISYTNSSGSGTVTAIAIAKGIGG